MVSNYIADLLTLVYHTFEGGCHGNGDGVDDTPAESQYFALSGTRGCNHGRDSCIGFGTDPVSNYMDYSDECVLLFSPIARFQTLTNMTGHATLSLPMAKRFVCTVNGHNSVPPIRNEKPMSVLTWSRADQRNCDAMRFGQLLFLLC